jgi:hypothetical protein
MFAKGTNNLEAYLKYLKAREIWMRFTEDDNRLTRQIIKEVIALDPNYPATYLLLGWTHWLDVVYGWSKSPKESFAQAGEMAGKVMELDDSLGGPHALKAVIYRIKKQFDKAIAEHKLAVLKIHAPGDISAFASTLLATKSRGARVD